MTGRCRFLLLTALVGFLFLSACAEKPQTRPGQLTLEPVTFEALPGWRDDRHALALPAFLKSCGVLLKKAGGELSGAGSIAGTAGDWRPACREAQENPLETDEDARRFFERHFKPYAAGSGATGLFTGYYEAEINGARQQGGPFQTPLWQKPDDLVTADLGAFRPELKGQRLAGKMEGRTFVPYDSRAAIAAGSLKGRARPLFWTDDPAAAFFLEIQGSGRVRLPDEQDVRIGYDGQNGHAYVPLGRVLADEGHIEKPVTMARIRNWLRAHPDKAQAMMNRNPSTVFFRRIDGEGPVGAQGVALTPERSLAVDPAYVPFGVPLWLFLTDDAAGAVPPPRLVVAQDAGGAIKGPVRGDLFWGSGPEAEARAGTMQSRGTYYLLLPQTGALDAAGR